MSQEIDLVLKINKNEFLHSSIVSKEELCRLNINSRRQKVPAKDISSLRTDCKNCHQRIILNVFWYNDELLIKNEPKIVIEPLIDHIKEEIKQDSSDSEAIFDEILPSDHSEDENEPPAKKFRSETSSYEEILYPGMTYLLPAGLKLPSLTDVEVPYFEKVPQDDGTIVYCEKKRKKKCPMRVTNYDPRSVKCDICGHSVPSSDRLTSHRKGHFFFKFTDEICRGCGKNCGDNNVEKLNHSLFCVGKDKINGLACIECSYVGKDYPKLRNHLKKNHRGYNPVPESSRENEVTCDLCNAKIIDESALLAHQSHKCPKLEEHRARKKVQIQEYLKDLDLPPTTVLPNIEKLKGKHSKMYPQPDGASIFVSRSRTHLEIMNFDPRRERCELCGKPHMLKKAEVVEHRLKRHFFPNPEDTKCPGCGKICTTPQQKIAHSHFCPEKHKIQVNFCQICEMQFQNYSRYAKHLRKRHNGEGLDKKYMCHYCSATYDTTRELKLHVIRHEDPRPFKCHHCFDDFKGKVGLESHLIRVHFPYLAKYSCNVCDPPVLFAKPKAYNAHINAVHVRTKEREPCRYCGALIRIVGMETHVKRQHTEHDLKQKIPCGICGKLFVSQTNLKVHERTHLPEHEREFKCRFCERRFNSRGVCIEHERFHTGEKPYKCDICGKGYARSQTLKDHKREHTGEVFTCQICGKTSTDRGNFRHHMKQHESQLGMKLTLNQEDRRLVKLRVITEEQALRGEGPS